MMADHAFVPRQKTIRTHFERFLSKLHNEGRAQVDQVSVANVWKKGIGKTFRILLVKWIKIRLPEKIYEVGKRALRTPAVIAVFKMIPVKKFHMLHRINVITSA